MTFFVRIFLNEFRIDYSHFVYADYFVVGESLNGAVALGLGVTHQKFSGRFLTLVGYFGLTDAFYHKAEFVRDKQILLILNVKNSLIVDKRRIVDQFWNIQSLFKLLGMLSHLLQIKIYLFGEFFL